MPTPTSGSRPPATCSPSAPAWKPRAAGRTCARFSESSWAKAAGSTSTTSSPRAYPAWGVRGKGKLSILAAVIAATGGAAWAAPAPRPELLEHGSGPGDDYLLLGNGAGERVVVVPRGDAYPPGLDLVRSRPGAPFGPPVRLRGFRFPTFEDASAIAPDGTMAIVGEPAATRPNQTHRLVAIVRDA